MNPLVKSSLGIVLSLIHIIRKGWADAQGCDPAKDTTADCDCSNLFAPVPALTRGQDLQLRPTGISVAASFGLVVKC
ncbi:hypothetical protein CBP51_10260 [Cellvibrio mixtus]|uniref:Uncharacterized protein n=1 Tax=Cellvibrio mixtus TaxID=39650 RepID=A0A266QBU1_9GAMM|nr:hypothetical protein B0D95_13710 [Cellvibrio sp. PSBB023]OZY87337.1 hypothetical protein CBP51_10260 [Cellvibrio mixtus]